MIMNYRIIQSEVSKSGLTPAVLMLHQATGDMNTYLYEAIRLSKLGINCALLEAPYSKKRNAISPRGLVTPQNERLIWDKTCEELEEITRTLIQKYGCDVNNMGFVGLNLGGSIGAYWILNRKQPLGCAVLSGSIPNLTSFWLESSHPVALKARSQENTNLSDFEEIMKNLDLICTLPKICHTRLLVQVGKQDDWINEESLQKLHSTISQQTNITLSTENDNHDMMALNTIEARIHFLSLELGVKPINPR